MTVASFYWTAQRFDNQYANLIVVDEATVLFPDANWNFGYKLGIGYNTENCDHWDLGLLWTHFKGRSSPYIEAAGNERIAIIG